MWKIFSLVIGILLPCGLVTAQAEDKEELIAEVLRTAKDFDNLYPVLNIIRRHGKVYRFVPSIAPLKEKYRISDKYGYRIHPITGKKTFHSGMDMAAMFAATVHATADGKITFAGTVSGYGKTIVITHRFGFQTRYAHLTYIYGKKGAKVIKGEVIGFVGSTGKSTGNHLHYEVIKDNKKINPINFVYGTKQ